MNPIPYVDGWAGVERELTVVPRPQFPFKTSVTPDLYTRLYERDYEVKPLAYLPKLGERIAWSNALASSDRFDDAAWTLTNVTIVTAGGTAPDGQGTMQKMVEAAANAEHRLSQAATVLASRTEFSVFAVGGMGRSWIRLSFVDSAAAVHSAFFNVENGETGPRSAGVSSRLTSLGKSEFQCVMQFTPAAGAGTARINLATGPATVSYVGSVSSGVKLWGAQVSNGTGAPYIATTTTPRTISAPVRDPLDPMAYLIEESDPQPGTSETEEVRRTFCRVPRQQISPGSMFIVKPDLDKGGARGRVVDFAVGNRLFGDVYGFGEYTYTNNLFFSQLLGASTVTRPTGGTFTLTYKGNTTGAINYDAADSVIAAALNALASVIADGLTFTVGITLTSPSAPRIAFTLSAGGTLSPVALNAAGLTPAQANVAFTFVASNTVQVAYIAARVTLASHGLNAAAPLLAFQENAANSAISNYWLLQPLTEWVVIDANTIAFRGTDQTDPPFTLFGQAAGGYSPGTVLSRIKRITDYFLPGVTPGINSIDDIPLPVYQGDPVSLIAAILAGSTSINYEVGDLEQWRESPILARTITTLNAAAL